MRIAKFGLLACVLGLSACGYTTAERAGIGAGVGAALGLGYAATDPYADPVGSALLGAAGGAAIGAIADGGGKRPYGGYYKGKRNRYNDGYRYYDDGYGDRGRGKSRGRGYYRY